MSTLTVEALRDLVQTGLSDATIQIIIDREEDELERRLGAASDGVTTSIVETKPGGGVHIYTRRPIASVTQVREQQILGDAFQVLAATQYYAWADEGRIARLPVAPTWSGGLWGPLVEVTYIPVDDRDRRRRVIIELVRLALEQTAMQGESVAGEYSYQAPVWEAVRSQLYRRLQFTEV